MKIVMYHADCPDGFGAAFAAWLYFGDREELDQVEFVPCRYGDPFPKYGPEDELYIFDFSFDRETMVTAHGHAKSLVVRDHHKTAQADLTGLSFAHFDMNKSGAVLAYEYFFPDDSIPELFLYLQDRDLWRWLLPTSREVSAAITSWPFDFKVWNQELFHECADRVGEVDHLIFDGEAILRSQAQQVEMNVRNTFLSAVGGFTVPVVNTNAKISETCHELCRRFRQYPFSAAYFDHPGGKRKWSLRSVGDFDVSAVCRQFGGGGHRNAAGFEVSPVDVVINLGIPGQAEVPVA